MGVERRGNRLYWYDRRRVNGRVVCEYLCPISHEDADLLRRRAELKKDRQETARADAAALVGRADEVLAAGAPFDRLAEQLFRAVMHLTGHARHRRGEWRRTRGLEAMATIQDTGAAPGRAPGKPAASAAADVQTIIDQAGRGGAPSLLALRELLKNPEAVEALGYPAVTARAMLIGMAAHDIPAVAAELVAHCERQTRQLLAECDPVPSFAEWMAAARVVNNWLAVHNLEALAASNPPAGAPAGAIDKRLTQAERRLHAALRSLAVLRRLRKPATAQVNIAKDGGRLVVNNAGAGAT